MRIFAMTTIQFAYLVFMLASPRLEAAETGSATTHDPGLYLFVDDHWIAEQTGLKRIVNRAKPLPSRSSGPTTPRPKPIVPGAT